jgi:flagellar basal-body rod protein FlgC
MDFLSAMQVSASGLEAERVRVNTAASNLANAESTRSPDGGPYRRLDPVFEVDPVGDGSAAGVHVKEIAADTAEPRRVYSPGHPDADADGFVALPNVNPVHETVNLLSAARGYEANASAIETLKSMAQRALDIGR